MARFNPRTYDPATDSSAGSDKFRKTGKEGVILIVVSEGDEKTCPSGNGKPVAAKRTFSQGGDARLKGIMQRAAATNTPITIVDPKGKGSSTTATKLAERYGFTKQVTAFTDRLEALAAESSKKGEAAAARKAAAAERKATEGAARKAAAEKKAKERAAAKAKAEKVATKPAGSSRRRSAAKPATEALAEANAAS